MTFRKFNSIVQFSNIVKSVRAYCQKYSKPLPVLKFYGSVKLHGSNACVSLVNDEVNFQSRERILTLDEDNAGFCAWGNNNLKKLYEILNLFKDESHSNVYIYGEWCGLGIQKGTALNQLKEKYFAIFEVIISDKNGNELVVNPVKYHEKINSLLQNVVVIDYLVKPLEITIDFQYPHLVQNTLLEETLKVENECPFGVAMGVHGIGEGIVWRCELDGFEKFKTKGEKHSSSKVKTVKELTEAEISKKESIDDFVEFALSENRLNQGLTKLEEMGLPFDIKSMGAYLKWVANDILTECADTIIESELERKEIMPSVNSKAKQWFLLKLNDSLNLA